FLALGGPGRRLGRGRPRPNPAQLAWQKAELGVVFHWDLHVFDGKRYHQAENRRTPPPDPAIFAPDRYDIDQWFEAVKGLGARFALLTACHETGFRLWQSEVNPFCLKAAPWRDGKADVVADFVAAAHRHGVAPGLYYGARWNARLGVRDFRVGERSPLSQEEYNRLVEAECRELATRYGELFEIWFDGGILTPEQGGPDVLPIFAEHQPRALFYHSDQRRDARWAGNENGEVPYPCWSTVDPERVRIGAHDPDALGHGDPDGSAWCPAMADAPLRSGGGRHEWFWEPGDEPAVLPLGRLLEMYERSVGRNATLILGLAPDPHGLVPEPDLGRCREFGAAVERLWGRPLATIRCARHRVDLDPPQPAVIDRIVLRERIEDGQRVKRYGLDGRRADDGIWIKLGEGSAIGNRRIHRIRPAWLDRVRLNHWTFDGGPAVIEEFSLYGRPVS
ncbi:MAG: glycoside hydrolase family 29, partial [Planctomycetota bacterium]